MLEFARALPRLRRRIERDLKRPGLGREKVIAAVVRLLEATRIRVGNEEYARANRSFGLTTLRDRHVVTDGAAIKFVFPAKSGRHLTVHLSDRRLNRVVMRCEELPGQRLFQYLDDGGEIQPVHSSDVNDYIREAAGGEFTAKDFRTWSGTVAAARFLLAAGVPTDLADARQIVVSAIDNVAELLFNTRAVCRKSYVHPALTDAYLNGGWKAVASAGESQPMRGLRVEEHLVIGLLSRSRGRTPHRAVARR